MAPKKGISLTEITESQRNIFPMMRFCLIFPLKNQTQTMALCVLCGLERKWARGIKSLTYPQSKAWTISGAEGLRG